MYSTPKWTRLEAKSNNISLPIPGRLLKTIKKHPFDHLEKMPIGSFVMFLLSEKASTPSVRAGGGDLEVWLFHMMVNGEKMTLHWYETVPNYIASELKSTPKILPFNWHDYWEYVSPEE